MENFWTRRHRIRWTIGRILVWIPAVSLLFALLAILIEDGNKSDIFRIYLLCFLAAFAFACAYLFFVRFGFLRSPVSSARKRLVFFLLLTALDVFFSIHREVGDVFFPSSVGIYRGFLRNTWMPRVIMYWSLGTIILQLDQNKEYLTP